MSVSPFKPAIFFDRDGTLIEDRGYVRSPSDVVLYDYTLSALQRLENNYHLFIVTNQPGIGLGVLSYEDVERVNQHIVETLARAGVTILKVYICPHTCDQGCECIKPKPYFLLNASNEFVLDLSRCFIIGDHPHDVELARSVGARGVYLLTGHGQKHHNEMTENKEIFIARDLDEAVTWILETRDSYNKGS